MEVILTQDIRGLGYRNDIIKVKPGYGRNYLIPGGMAILATPSNKKVVAENVRQASFKEAKRQEEAQAVLERLVGLRLSLPLKASEEGKIFGTVTALQLTEAIQAQGITLDRRQITFPQPVKSLGSHQAYVEVYKGVSGNFTFEVVAEKA